MRLYVDYHHYTVPVFTVELGEERRLHISDITSISLRASDAITKPAQHKTSIQKACS